MLNIAKENTWIPPEIDTMQTTLMHMGEIDQDLRTEDQDKTIEWLLIFRLAPFIDALYVNWNPAKSDKPVIESRFCFHEGYAWTYDDEKLFVEKCLNNPNCIYSYASIDEIYALYANMHPEWHLQRYFTKSLRLLDHIYHCMKQDSVQEILYKAGLDELAAGIDEMDEINLLSVKPSDVYEGLTMRTLRALNCQDGAMLLSRHRNRLMLRELQVKFPEIFKEKLNDAQCRYINRLIEGDLTFGEVGRLYLSRRSALSAIWCKSLYEMFIWKESVYEQNVETAKELSQLEPIYKKYIDGLNLSPGRTSTKLQELRYYLLLHRDEYDKDIRRSNRKREEDWQERKYGYVVRYPQTINDFCRESVYMCNCLLTYTDAFINGDTTILFIRRIEAVNEPFITMEIYNNRLMQAYHRYNEDCTAEEAEWIVEYCDRHCIDPGRFSFGVNDDELF